jgi:hypothetical protein
MPNWLKRQTLQPIRVDEFGEVEKVKSGDTIVKSHR